MRFVVQLKDYIFKRERVDERRGLRKDYVPKNTEVSLLFIRFCFIWARITYLSFYIYGRTEF